MLVSEINDNPVTKTKEHKDEKPFWKKKGTPSLRRWPTALAT
jgi:hypothetical protein